MLEITHFKESSRGLVRCSIPFAAIAASILLTSCGDTGAEGDISDTGQIAYACALAEHVEAEHGAQDSWDAYIGNDANDGAREASAIGMLTVGSHDTALRAAGEDLLEAITRLDIDLLNTGLEDIQDACGALDIAQDVDVSHEAQLDYACALVHGVADKHGSASAWIEVSDHDAWYELASAAALTGGANGQWLEEHQELSQAGIELLRAVQVNDSDQIDANLETFQSACMGLEKS